MINTKTIFTNSLGVSFQAAVDLCLGRCCRQINLEIVNREHLRSALNRSFGGLFVDLHPTHFKKSHFMQLCNMIRSFDLFLESQFHLNLHVYPIFTL